MVAEVIINSIAKDLNKTFDYVVPNELSKDIKVGTRVFVPFGRQKQEEGFVINIKEESKFASKEIIAVEDNILEEEQVKLAVIMARRYFCNISDCIKLMLPPGNTSKKIDTRVKDKTANFVYLNKDIEEIEFAIETQKIKSAKQIKILNFLKENEGILISDLELLTDTTRSTIKTLEKNGYIDIAEEKVERNPFTNRNIKRDKPLKLTEEQQNAFNKIVNSKFKEFLIYGITGSRQNRNLFTTHTKCNRTKQNSYSFSSRNIFNTTNGR